MLVYQMIHEVFVLSDACDQRALEEFNLSPSQFRLLSMLNDGTGHRLTHLSERLLRSKSTVTRVVDALEEMSLVERIPDPADRRAQRVVLTPKGSGQLESAAMAHQRSLEQRLGHFDRKEQQQFESLLRKLSASLSDVLETNGKQDLDL